VPGLVRRGSSRLRLGAAPAGAAPEEVGCRGLLPPHLLGSPGVLKARVQTSVSTPLANSSYAREYRADEYSDYVMTVARRA
jgi:hypothetical protein